MAWGCCYAAPCQTRLTHTDDTTAPTVLLSTAMLSNTQCRCVCSPRGQRWPPLSTVSRAPAGQLLGILVLAQVPQEPTGRGRVDNIIIVTLVFLPALNKHSLHMETALNLCG